MAFHREELELNVARLVMLACDLEEGDGRRVQ